MKQALINCPSLANSSLLELEEDIRQFWNSGVRWFHIDIMDGTMCQTSVIRCGWLQT